ncbi:hypothetical protein MTO96_003679 [Rhipicephalus appendiculatus]
MGQGVTGVSAKTARGSRLGDFVLCTENTVADAGRRHHKPGVHLRRGCFVLPHAEHVLVLHPDPGAASFSASTLGSLQGTLPAVITQNAPRGVEHADSRMQAHCLKQMV